MSAPDLSVEAANERAPEDLVEAGFYRSAAEGFEHGLVVLAMGWPYWLVPSDGGQRLLVEPPVATAAREQLARFDRESVGWPPRPVGEKFSPRKPEFVTPLAWC